MRDHTTGIAIITGKVDGETKINVNRLVYFNYTQQFRTRILHTARIVKTFSDTVTDEKFEKILSQFFLKKGGELTLTVDEYQSAYVFSKRQCAVSVLQEEMMGRITATCEVSHAAISIRFLVRHVR